MKIKGYTSAIKALSIIGFLFLSLNSKGQYKLKDIPYKLSAINKKNEKGKQGVWYSYSQDSTISNMQTYRNDTLNGYYEIYWPTGRILQLGYFKKGLLDSIAIAFWEDGISKRIEETYALGKLNGISKMYDRNGLIIEAHKFIDDRIDPEFEASFLKNKNTSDEQDIDTIITNDKVYTIYTLMKKGVIIRDLYYIGSNLFVDEIYEKGVLVKRMMYTRTEDNYMERIHYYLNGEKYRTEFYDKSGKIINEVFEKD